MADDSRRARGKSQGREDVETVCDLLMAKKRKLSK